ncbi:hypothetical protein [Paenibacillus sp. YYML68]|uniref:hypothetical protein n=1 Tax=Paenibacillus sp. YYML68 TaxID=2909250 RepID=UPI002490DB3F|nr:hypothetical protein [Paenibacillus sp. YYML68]
MKQSYAQKLLVSSLAAALLLGGGTYGLSYKAQAEESPAAPAATAEAAPQQNADKAAEHSKHKDKHHAHALIEEASSVLSMSQAELKQALKDKTLAEVASDKGVSEAELIAKLKDIRLKQLDAAVISGKLTAEKAELMKSKLDEHLKFMVSHKLRELDKHKGGKHSKSAMHPSPGKLAELLGMTENELKAELKAGKSLTEIAAAKGISKEQLINKIQEELTPKLEKLVDHKRGDKQND